MLAAFAGRAMAGGILGVSSFITGQSAQFAPRIRAFGLLQDKCLL